jgi:hypothetical protein
MAGAVQGSEANIGTGMFDGQLSTAAASPASFSDFFFFSRIRKRFAHLCIKDREILNDTTTRRISGALERT